MTEDIVDAERILKRQFSRENAAACLRILFAQIVDAVPSRRFRAEVETNVERLDMRHVETHEIQAVGSVIQGHQLINERTCPVLIRGPDSSSSPCWIVYKIPQFRSSGTDSKIHILDIGAS